MTTNRRRQQPPPQPDEKENVNEKEQEEQEDDDDDDDNLDFVEGEVTTALSTQSSSCCLSLTSSLSKPSTTASPKKTNRSLSQGSFSSRVSRTNSRSSSCMSSVLLTADDLSVGSHSHSSSEPCDAAATAQQDDAESSKATKRGATPFVTNRIITATSAAATAPSQSSSHQSILRTKAQRLKAAAASASASSSSSSAAGQKLPCADETTESSVTYHDPINHDTDSSRTNRRRRTVRFSQDSAAATSTIPTTASQSSSSTNQSSFSRRSSRASTKSTTKCPKDEAEWFALEEEEEQQEQHPQQQHQDYRLTRTRTVSHQTNKRSNSSSLPVWSPQNIQIPCQRPSLMRQTNLYAIQDSGNYQMLHDEAMFLCSSILELDPSQRLTNSRMRAGRLSHARQAATDLAVLLSEKDHRTTLLGAKRASRVGVAVIGDGRGSSWMDGNRQDDAADESLLERILNVIGFCRTLVQDQPERQQFENDNQGDDDDDDNDDDASRLSMSSPMKGGRKRRYAGSKTDIHAVDQTTLLVDAITMILHFLSLDCTLAPKAATSRRTACWTRLQFLQHPAAMQGILNLVLDDPLLAHSKIGYCSNGELPCSIVQLQLPKRHSASAKHAMGVTATAAQPPTSPLNHFQGESQDSTIASVDDEKDEFYQAQESQQSHMTHASSQSSSSARSHGSVNPTFLGRRKRKKRRMEKQQQSQTVNVLQSIPEETKEGPSSKLAPPNGGGSLSFSLEKDKQFIRGHDDNQDEDDRSLATTDSQLVKAQQDLDTVALRIMKTLPAADNVSSTYHNCGIKMNELTQNIPLLALTRIVNGKLEGMEESCYDVDPNFHRPEDDDDDDEGNNPLLVTNRLIGESGMVPLLSTALAESLAAIAKLAQETKPICEGCLSYLFKRVHLLVSLIDSASLLNDTNRQEFTMAGNCKELGGPLIIGSISFLQKLLDTDKLLDGVWGEISLEVLRMVTSLTHENQAAAKAVEKSKATNNREAIQPSLTTMARVLHYCVCNKLPTSCDKVKYDATIFCLNSLANVIESGAARKLVAELSILDGLKDGKDKQPFLRWLVQWLVSETSSFQDAVVGSTFGASPSKHSERRLEAHEDDKLVRAGNGFVLLACLMLGNAADDSVDVPNSVQRIILEGLPAQNNPSKILFMMNTLKAFCNFYRYSVGDLSVAVVAPVKQLIGKLEVLQKSFM